MFKVLHQCNNVVKTTQLTSDFLYRKSDAKILLSLWMFEVSTTSSKVQHKF